MVNNLSRWKQKEQQLLVLNIKEHTVIAEDVERILFIIKKKDAPPADSENILKWEDMMDGLKKLEQEEDKELEEWDIWRMFPEKLKMDLEVEQLLNPLKEKLNDL